MTNEMMERDIADDFRKRVMSITGDDSELLKASDQELISRLTIAQYAADVLINAAEKRGLIETHEGGPVIPYELPAGIEVIETILTRKHGEIERILDDYGVPRVGVETAALKKEGK